jgi:8-oxo-dGTP pyrophosphatase MutT (NUDIX family)
VSFISAQTEKMEMLYGKPDCLSTTQKMTAGELAVVRASMKDGRAHDITLYIKKGDGYIFIAKPFYPPGLYRAPSGGIHRGEDFESGARREAREETGVDIELGKYILRINVRFQSADELVDWTSHVFTALYTGGKIEPRDRSEIREAKVVYAGEIPKLQEMMRNSGSGGLIYRAYLTGESSKRL